MEYREGKIGRVFVLRVDDGEDILESITALAEEKEIEKAFLFMLGACRTANLVTGPLKDMIPPEPLWNSFVDPHEIIGIGNIMLENKKPVVHLHTGLGRDGKASIGCMRKYNEAFMVTEILLLEIDGMDAVRKFDSKRGFAPINFGEKEN
ncbi:PPC domain-containing DNA-binding protein [Methanohalophilus mahii]|uniref:PPC domain-containing protein n=1 Tax=Methanohalophilus mahii (strain ATCC 35705 / DSM 5219 / SLP) TaxID=547558 RepID=D5E8J7_METMS|nr:DUF296 domain-containing protein [Methanohalophilus mahii]ADE37485.1 protein of unknown function DUF296 [Methanohalophilus mahii DSM 5219]